MTNHINKKTQESKSTHNSERKKTELWRIEKRGRQRYQSKSFGWWACRWGRWSQAHAQPQRQWRSSGDSSPKTSMQAKHREQARLQERPWLSLTGSSPIETAHSQASSSSSPWYQPRLLCTWSIPLEKETRLILKEKQRNKRRNKNYVVFFSCVLLRGKEWERFDGQLGMQLVSDARWHLCCFHSGDQLGKNTSNISLRRKDYIGSRS